MSIKVWFLPYFDWVGGLFSDKNHTFLKYSNSSRNAKNFFFNYVHPPSWQASLRSATTSSVLSSQLYIQSFMLLGFMRFINVPLVLTVFTLSSVYCLIFQIAVKIEDESHSLWKLHIRSYKITNSSCSISSLMHCWSWELETWLPPEWCVGVGVSKSV